MNLKLNPIASAVILALYGCASHPPMPPQPNMRANASMPSCVAFCEVSVTTEFAQEEISSTGGGAVTGGAISEAATTSQSETATPTVGVGSPIPKPKKDDPQ